jgi:hydrogenase-4 component E
VANKRIKSYIVTFRVQSLLIGLTAGIMGIEGLRHNEGMDLLIVCAIILALKAFYIPRLLNRTFVRVEYTVEKDFFFNIPLLVLVSCGLVVFSYYSLSAIDVLSSGKGFPYIVNSVSVVLIGLFFMISRKKAIGQIVGFLVVENGLFITAMFATHGMPIVIDLGIFIDLLTAILIMGLMVFRINNMFESIDINKLKKLRG